MIMSQLYDFVPLAAHCDIVCGPAFASAQFTSNQQDIPLVKGDSVQQGFVDWKNAKRWPYDAAHGYEKYYLRSGDVVVAMDRPWVTAGLKWSYIRDTDPTSLLVQRVARIRGRATLHQGFLRCLVGSSYFSSYIKPIVTGVNVPHISAKQIGRFRIPLPHLDTQKKIAAILTAYDDLIENIRQRIALLGQMAEEIYREWFVRLRFPGHEHTPVHKGVPDGWNRRSIDELSLLVKRGISPRYDEKSEHIVINQKCIRDHHVSFDQARPHAASMSKDKLLRRHDVLINSTGVGTLGRAAIYNLETTKVTVDSHVTICRPNTDLVDATFYGFTVRSFETIFESFAAGATGQTELSARLVKSIDMFDPPDTLQRRFSEIVGPMLDSQSVLLAQSENLAKTRDLLLNRLISGKLRIDDLDFQFPPSMQDVAA